MWLWARVLSLLLLFSTQYSTLSRTNIDTAVKHRGETEKRYNRSQFIDLINRFTGNALGSPYCAAFVSYCNSFDKDIPYLLKSGLARTFWTSSRIPKELKHSAEDVLRGRYAPKFGDMVIWANGSTMTGHIGFVLYYDPKAGVLVTIEANTSPGSSGSQSNGDGFYIRIRRIEVHKYFHIIGFVETRR
jgi:hypothetical protein